MIEVALYANTVEAFLDELQVSGTRKNSRHLLERAALASIRGLEILSQEPFVIDPDMYLKDLAERCDMNVASIREELREDSVRLRLFLQAECRLLQDLGVSDAVVSLLRRELVWTIRSEPEDLDNLHERLFAVISSLEAEMVQLENQDNHASLVRKLVGVVEALGGALVIGADAAVGVPGALVTGGLSVVGAGVSGAFGTEMVSRGAKRALG